MDFFLVLKFVAAFSFVLSLMALLAWGGKRLGVGDALKSGRRLGVIEYLPLVARRKLVIVRRDDREHLILLGVNSETVLESGLKTPGANVVDMSVAKVEKNV